MKWQQRLGFCLFFLLLLAGCGKDRGCRQTTIEGAAPLALPITRLEQSLGNLQDTAAAAAFLAQHPGLTSSYFMAGPAASRQAVLALLTVQAKDPYMDTLRRDVQRLVPSVKEIETDLGQMLGRVKAAYPAFVAPTRAYTMASGFNVDLMLVDSLLLIGLENFLPEGAHYEPPQTPHYIRARMRPETVVPGVARLISQDYNVVTPAGQTAMVDEMVRWGKTLYFTAQTMPCLPDSTLYGYPAATLAEIEKAQTLIYAHFVDNNLFFSTDQLLANKYCGERPSIPEIGPRCPGRIGQWMGYQIVSRYAQEKKLSLPQLMAEPDARKIFDQARWHPR